MAAAVAAALLRVLLDPLLDTEDLDTKGRQLLASAALRAHADLVVLEECRRTPSAQPRWQRGISSPSPRSVPYEA